MRENAGDRRQRCRGLGANEAAVVGQAVCIGNEQTQRCHRRARFNALRNHGLMAGLCISEYDRTGVAQKNMHYGNRNISSSIAGGAEHIYAGAAPV
jgi:hypothetical protein